MAATSAAASALRATAKAFFEFVAAEVTRLIPQKSEIRSP
jgi:hypothetical protein